MTDYVLKAHPSEHWFDRLTIAPTTEPTYSFELFVELVDRFACRTQECDETKWVFEYECGMKTGGDVTLLEKIKSDDARLAIATLGGAFHQQGMLNFASAYSLPVAVDFYNRGALVYRHPYANLLSALLGFPLVERQVMERDRSALLAVQRSRKLKCSHPGCHNQPSRVMKILYEYDKRGNTEGYVSHCYRQFCDDHMERGGGYRDDSNENYAIAEEINCNTFAVN